MSLTAGLNSQKNPTQDQEPNDYLTKQTHSTKEEHLSHLWIMFYRHGMNANLTKGFYFAGDILAARNRAIKHCQVMGYRFIFIRPMVVNLEREEEYKLKGLGSEGEFYT